MSGSLRGSRALWLLVAFTAFCYLIGYPLALVAHSSVGWVFVGLGGPLLIATGVMTIRRIADSDRPVEKDRKSPR